MFFSTTTILLIAASVLLTVATQNLTMARRLPQTMKAVGFYKYMDISDPKSLQDFEVKLPEPGKSEVLVEVKAIAVNPIDTKIRATVKSELPVPRILGWDGAGIVVSKHETVNTLNVGDEVIFTGDIGKNGSDAQYVTLNEIMVAPKPEILTFAEAAAMPLTSATAYEALYDRMGISEKDKGKSLLIINSSGGVGSVASQLAKNLGMKVIGTASRPETEAFSRQYGVELVLNHRKDLIKQLEANNITEVDYIMVNYDPFPYWDTLMKVIKPQGTICLIVDSSQPVDIRPLKDKSITLVSESMATRIKYNTPDIKRHNDILRRVSKMLDEGKLKTTLSKTITPINAANLREAHRIIENQQTIGKIVLHGF